MKHIFILLMTFGFFSTSVQAYSTCPLGLEAQVIGHLTAKTQVGQDCLGQVSFSYFNSSIVCPLDISDVAGKNIQLKDCSAQVGDSVSGILILDGHKLYFE